MIGHFDPYKFSGAKIEFLQNFQQIDIHHQPWHRHPLTGSLEPCSPSCTYEESITTQTLVLRRFVFSYNKQLV